MEQFRGGNVESAGFRRKVIDSFANAVYLWDDHIKIAFNYSGKGSAVDMDVIMETEVESFMGSGRSYAVCGKTSYAIDSCSDCSRTGSNAKDWRFTFSSTRSR